MSEPTSSIIVRAQRCNEWRDPPAWLWITTRLDGLPLAVLTERVCAVFGRKEHDWAITHIGRMVRVRCPDGLAQMARRERDAEAELYRVGVGSSADWRGKSPSERIACVAKAGCEFEARSDELTDAVLKMLRAEVSADV